MQNRACACEVRFSAPGNGLDRIRLLDVAAGDISFIRPKGDITPPSTPIDAIDLVYARSLPGNGQGNVRLNGLDNADFQWVQDAIIFG